MDFINQLQCRFCYCCCFRFQVCGCFLIRSFHSQSVVFVAITQLSYNYHAAQPSPPAPKQNNNAYISVTDRRPPPTPTPHHPLFHHTTNYIIPLQSPYIYQHLPTTPVAFKPHTRPSQSHPNQPCHPIFTDFSIVSPTLSSHPASQPANQSPPPLVPSTLPRNPHNVPWPLLNTLSPRTPDNNAIAEPTKIQEQLQTGICIDFVI